MIFLFCKKSLIFCCFSLLIGSFLTVRAESAQIIDPKPSPTTISLDGAWKSVLRSAEKRQLTALNIKETSSLWFETAKNYYRIQWHKEALEKAEETKKHFDQAVAKAESSYDDDDENVTQFIITKLKLGLAKMKDEIAEHKSGLDQAKVELGALMDKDFFDPLVKVENPLKAASFSYQSWEVFLEKNPNFLSEEKNLAQNDGSNLFGDLKLEFIVRSRQAFIRVLEARKKMKTARKVSKSLRALMAMESSNYDLGLGNPVDLFDSFLAHARHINVSLESIYNFNIAVAEWRKVTGRLP